MPEPGRIFIVGLEDVILQQARAAAAAARRASSPRDEGGNVITAIILAVAAVEALVGTWSAIFHEDYAIDDGTLRTWRRRGAPDILKDILGRLNPPIPVQDVGWYQPLCAIVALRNHAAHYFPEFRVPGTWPEGLEPYVRNRTFSPMDDDEMDWTSRLLVSSVAVQVVEYTAEIVDGFMSVAWRGA
jgi:hypothetical protein